MSIFSRYPYTDFHRLNADWILDKVKEAASSITEALGLVRQSAADAAASAAAAQQAAEGSVRWDRAQELTTAQQRQAQTNINTVDASVVARLDLAIHDLDTTIAAIQSAGTVRYDQAQQLTSDQQTQSRGNIGAASSVEVNNLSVNLEATNIALNNTRGIAQAAMSRADIALIYEEQELTTEQQQQVRTNIGAAAAGEVPAPAGAVLYDQAQSLSTSQKEQARSNIACAPTFGPEFTGAVSIKSTATPTVADDIIDMYTATLVNDTVSRLQLTGSVSPLRHGVIISGVEDPSDNLDAANKQFVLASLLKQITVTGNAPSISLSQDIDGSAYETLYDCSGSALTSVTISTSANSHYLATIVFTTGSTPPTLDSPLDILGLDDLVPAANTTYEISIRSKRAVWHAWEVSA